MWKAQVGSISFFVFCYHIMVIAANVMGGVRNSSVHKARRMLEGTVQYFSVSR